MEIRVLGPLEVVDPSGEPLSISGAKERALLGALLVDPGEIVSTDRLIDVLWPGDPPSNPTNALQARISALRRSLGDRSLVVAQSPGYRLAIDRDSIDSTRFQRYLEEARRSAADCLDTALGLYDQALDLCRGDPFADFLYQDFARDEIARLEEMRATAREERIQVLLDTGRHAEAVIDLEALVVRSPLRERLWGQFMLALYRSGRQAEALRAYRDAARILGEELGIEPSPELRELEVAILNQDPSLSAPAREQNGSRHNLPARITSLIGRSADIERIVELLDDHRLVTVTGPGGVGKTSLAVACGEAALRGFGGGVWLVELAGVTDPSLVPAAIARGLGLETGDGSTLEVVCEVFRHRHLLLLLDNCEHLIDGVAEVAVTILHRAPDVRIIATSREPLGISGELLWPTRPLASPAESSTGEASSYDAVQLFVERAEAAHPDFRLDAETAPAVADICRRLDGLPLALELAAARVRTLSVHDIAERLDDRFRLLGRGPRAVMPRQQTLESAIAWSSDLLTDDERALFRQVSVFAGGWTLAAAEAVAPPADEALDLLERLVDRSLVTVEATRDARRFSMLETIRAYASLELARSGGREAAARRHARWFLQLAELAEFQGPAQSEWAARLSDEHENLRSAVRYALAHDEPEIALRLGGAMGWWWFFGNREEGRAVLDELLTSTAGVATGSRVSALHSRALLDLFNPTARTFDIVDEALELSLALGDTSAAARSKTFLALRGIVGPASEQSLTMLDEALAVFRQTGDGWGAGFAHFQRMEVLGHSGDLRSAIEEGETALALLRPTGDLWAVSAALAHLGRYGRLTGRLDWAEKFTDEALDVAGDRHLPHTVQFVLTDRAYLNLTRRHLDVARELFDRATTIARDIGNQAGLATAQNGRGDVCLAAGMGADAEPFHRFAEEAFARLDAVAGIAYSRTRLGLAAEWAHDWGRASHLHTGALDAASSTGGIVDLVPCLEGLGRAAGAGGDHERAARLLAAGSVLRTRTALAALPFEAETTETAWKRVEQALGPEVRVNASQEALTLDPASMVASARM